MTEAAQTLSYLTNVCWIDLPSITDSRGVLTSVEASVEIPFCIKRVIYIHNIVSDRGGRTYQDTDQIIITISSTFFFHLLVDWLLYRLTQFEWNQHKHNFLFPFGCLVLATVEKVEKIER